MTYNYPEDNKLHTRFSELSKCTPGQIERVMDERRGLTTPFTNHITEFGSIRHSMLNEYIKEHKKLPKKFGLEIDCLPERSEKHIAIELFPNAVLHGTPDCFGDDWIADFKTTTRGTKAYAKSKQVTFYAMMLKYYGLDIKKVYYLCELWDTERTKILGYESICKEISQEDIKEVYDWTRERVSVLKQAIKEQQSIGARI